jgi:hypothetical protein
MSTVERKYVVIYNPDTGELFIDVIPKWKYHADIFGETLEAPLRFWSAGHYSFENDDPETIKVFGKSIGLQIGPKSGDDIMLKAYERDGEFEFKLDEIRALHRERLGVKSVA